MKIEYKKNALSPRLEKACNTWNIGLLVYYWFSWKFQLEVALLSDVFSLLHCPFYALASCDTQFVVSYETFLR